MYLLDLYNMVRIKLNALHSATFLAFWPTYTEACIYSFKCQASKACDYLPRRRRKRPRLTRLREMRQGDPDRPSETTTVAAGAHNGPLRSSGAKCQHRSAFEQRIRKRCVVTRGGRLFSDLWPWAS